MITLIGSDNKKTTLMDGDIMYYAEFREGHPRIFFKRGVSYLRFARKDRFGNAAMIASRPENPEQFYCVAEVVATLAGLKAGQVQSCPMGTRVKNLPWTVKFYGYLGQKRRRGRRKNK